MIMQIQEFINDRYIKILDKIGQSIAERAVVLFDDYMKRKTDLVTEDIANGFEMPTNQPILQVDFQDLVRSIIRDEVSLGDNTKANNVARNLINKALNEYEAMLEKE